MSTKKDIDNNIGRHAFPWKWYLKDLPKVPKHGHTVFSTFSCGGGSTMGYKLAGYTVLGNCEIDKAMSDIYRANHHPKFSYLADIRDFNKLEDLPKELYHLDILDGSPPCSTFSTVGDREDSWGKEKVFREGQKMQTLDDLFFVFLETVGKLKPKVVVAENVHGLVKGYAKGYVNEIVKGFRQKGYEVQLFLLNSAYMGVPQQRPRVFFIAHKAELPYSSLRLNFSEPLIPFREVRSEHGIPIKEGTATYELMKLRRDSDRNLWDVNKRATGKQSMFGYILTRDNEVSHTVTSGGGCIRSFDGEYYSDADFINVQTFPQDYNFGGQSVQYVCGMSVPPVMMAQIARQIYLQWFKPEEESSGSVKVSD